MTDPVLGRLPRGGDMEMVHADHANGGGWRLGGRKEDFPCRRDSLSKGQEIRHNMMFK